MERIMSYHQNKKNILMLKEKMAKRENVAVFVGAGASKFLGIKTWKEIIQEMNEELGPIPDYKESIRNRGYPRTATAIYEVRNDENLYKSFLKNQFIPKSGSHYSLHSKLLTTFKIILTTNFDTSFEKAFDDLNNYLERSGHDPNKKNVQKLPEFDANIDQDDFTIIYLHGNNDDEIYIFKQEEYEFYYPSKYGGTHISRLETFLTEIIEKFTLVFIGFSFTDEAFLYFFKKILKDFEYRKMKHRSLHGKEYNCKLPSNFGIFRKDNLKTTVSKKWIVERFKDDDSWESFFVNPDEEELKFKPEIKETLESLNLTNEIEELVDDLFEACINNESKMTDFKDLNLNLICIDEHIETEYILDYLLEDILTLKEDTEGASYG